MLGRNQREPQDPDRKWHRPAVLQRAELHVFNAVRRSSSSTSRTLQNHMWPWADVFSRCGPGQSTWASDQDRQGYERWTMLSMLPWMSAIFFSTWFKLASSNSRQTNCESWGEDEGKPKSQRRRFCKSCFVAMNPLFTNKQSSGGMSESGQMRCSRRDGFLQKRTAIRSYSIQVYPNLCRVQTFIHFNRTQ